MAVVKKTINWSIFQGSFEEQEKLKELLTFKDPRSDYLRKFRYRGWDGTVKLYRKRKNCIAIRTGLIDYLKTKFNNLQIIDFLFPLEICDMLDIKDKLRDYQVQAIKAVHENSLGIISLPTGGGKTWIGAGIFKSIRVNKYVFVVHREELFTQVYDFFVTLYGDEVGRVGGKYDEREKKYIVAMIQTLYSQLKRGDHEWFFQIECMVIDEAHRASANSYKRVIDNCDGLLAKVGLTGTIPAEDTYAGLELRGILGSVIFDMSLKNLIERAYIVRPFVYMYRGCSRKYLYSLKTGKIFYLLTKQRIGYIYSMQGDENNSHMRRR